MLKKSVISNLILTENFLSFYTIVSFVLFVSWGGRNLWYFFRLLWKRII